MRTVIEIQKTAKTNVYTPINKTSGVTFYNDPIFEKKDIKTQAELIYNIVYSQPLSVRVQIHSAIRNMLKPVDGVLIDENMTQQSFLMLSKLSQQKTATYHFRKAIFKNNPKLLYLGKEEQDAIISEKLKLILSQLEDSWDVGKDIMKNSIELGFPLEIWMLGEAFIKKGNHSRVSDVQGELLSLDDNYYTEERDIIKDLFQTFPSNKSKKYYDVLFGEESAFEGIKGKLPEAKSLKNKGVESLQNTTIPYNPFIADLSLPKLVEQFGKKEFKELFDIFYGKIANNLLQKFGGLQLSDSLLKSVSAIDIDEDEEKGKIYDALIFQRQQNGKSKNIDFEQKLSGIGFVVQTLIKDLKVVNNPAPVKYNPHEGYIKPLSGRNMLKGFYREKTFLEGANVAHYKNGTGEELMQLTIKDELTMTDIVYLLVQIGYYLNHDTILKENELYESIFREYTKNKNIGESVYDISIFEKQYDQFIENVVFPLSVEGQSLGLRPLSTLLAGTTGTGKSQFLLNLLLNDSFSHEGKEIDVNAMVISVSIPELIYIVMNDKTIINRVVEKTKMPLVIVVEDVDTPMQEGKRDEGDMFSEQLTTLMTGVSSERLTIISATNHWRGFSSRLIRPDRFENIISFPLPLNSVAMESIIDTHAKKEKLTEREITIVKSYLDRMTYFSASYIVKFVRTINARKIFNRKIKGKGNVISSKEIEEIFKNIMIPIKDIQAQEEDLKNRETSLKNKETGKKIGYN